MILATDVLYDEQSNPALAAGVAFVDWRSEHSTREYALPIAGIPVLRGESKSPLYVTAAGMDMKLAAYLVQTMHGPHRLPTMLKRVDSLSRGRIG